MTVSTRQQPPREQPLLPREWLQRYDAVRIVRHSDGKQLDVPGTTSVLSFLDFNPRWYIDQLVRTQGRTLFSVALDMTNSCTDSCPMCFTMAKRKAEGMKNHMDGALALRRLAELHETYPDTFRMVFMSGSGEPLSMPHVTDLIDGVTELGLAIRLYTAGKHLRKADVRASLLAAGAVIRISLDAASERSFRATHAAKGLDERCAIIRQVVQERDATGSSSLIGAHFVIQKANLGEIVAFAEQARELGCDFVAYSQETYGQVAGGFTEDDLRQVMDGLLAVEAMHTDRFGVMVPKLARRPTITRFDKDYIASRTELDLCHRSRHHLFFGVADDYSACCLAGLDTSFKEQSLVGPLAEPTTMRTLHTVVNEGVGAGLGRPAKLSCNSCMVNNYNRTLDSILAHLSGESGWDCDLLPYTPGMLRDDYELTVSGPSDQVLAAPAGKRAGHA
ncbi:radical SAM protein [Streptomyces chrestomyceticus]|uniref:radical SAM protein n=1 Tax=Streptomyces chrestomyceticus TaxID=68185 RepID=UPI0037A876F3